MSDKGLPSLLDTDKGLRSRLDSGYNTDVTPSPRSSSLKSKTVFFGDDENLSSSNTEVFENKDLKQNARDNPVVSDDKQTDEFNQSDRDIPERDYEVIETGLKKDAVHDIAEDRDIPTEVLEVDKDGDKNVNDIKLDKSTCTDIGNGDHVTNTEMPHKNYSDLGIILERSHQGASWKLEQHLTLRRSTSLPDITILHMRVTQKVGRRLRRMSDEFYYSVLFGKMCKVCSNKHTDDKADRLTYLPP